MLEESLGCLFSFELPLFTCQELFPAVERHMDVFHFFFAAEHGFTVSPQQTVRMVVITVA